MTTDISVVLASASPRRRELLAQLAVPVEVSPADIDESVLPAESPAAYVQRLAREKALKVAASFADKLVIGADTSIADNDLILGKPESKEHAIEMLSTFAGRQHMVHTGVAVSKNDVVESCVVTTLVEFLSVSRQDIEHYVETGEPFGKAGGYAIQGIGAMLVKKIEGSYSNVVGLPLAETATLLKRFGYCVLSRQHSGFPGN